MTRQRQSSLAMETWQADVASIKMPSVKLTSDGVAPAGYLPTTTQVDYLKEKFEDSTRHPVTIRVVSLRKMSGAIDYFAEPGWSAAALQAAIDLGVDTIFVAVRHQTYSLSHYWRVTKDKLEVNSGIAADPKGWTPDDGYVDETIADFIFPTDAEAGRVRKTIAEMDVDWSQSSVLEKQLGRRLTQ
jgi:hypothetical protein